MKRYILMPKTKRFRWAHVTAPYDLEWRVRGTKFITTFPDGFVAEFEFKISSSELSLKGVFGDDIYIRADEETLED